MEKIVHYFKLAVLCIYVFYMRIKKIFLFFLFSICIFLIFRHILVNLWQFRAISGYEWDFSITLYEVLIGVSALISAMAIISSGILWIINKLNKNKTILESCQPYIRIDDDNIFPIKSQHEFNQILREAPLNLLQVSSIFFIITFSSVNKNESKVIYKSTCKPRFGLLWILKTENENLDDKLLVRIKRIKSFLFEITQYEDYIFKDNGIVNNVHKLSCQIILDPMLFLMYNKDIAVSIRIENTDKSKTSWYRFSLKIEDKVINVVTKKLQKHIAEENPEKWLKTWRENLKKNNESKFDFEGRI